MASRSRTREEEWQRLRDAGWAHFWNRREEAPLELELLDRSRATAILGADRVQDE